MCFFLCTADRLNARSCRQIIRSRRLALARWARNCGGHPLCTTFHFNLKTSRFKTRTCYKNRSRQLALARWARNCGGRTGRRWRTFCSRPPPFRSGNFVFPAGFFPCLLFFCWRLLRGGGGGPFVRAHRCPPQASFIFRLFLFCLFISDI